MKRISIIFSISAFVLGILVSAGCLAQTVSFRADERFELTGIAARLAGYQEYRQGVVQSYNAAIDSYFAEFAGHDLITFMKRIRNENRIAYDAVPRATQALVIENGGISISQDADIAALCEADPRWTEDNFMEFAELTDRFYRETNFHKFYVDNSSLYRRGNELMSKIAPVDTSWFGGFFGKDMSKVGLCLAFVNGPNSYLMPDNGIIDGASLVYGLFFDPTVIDPQQIDGRTADVYIPGVISNLCGVMVSPIVEEYGSLFEDAADVFFNQYDIRNIMRRNGVEEPERLVYDWLQSLCTALYFKDNGLVSFDYASVVSSAARKGCFWLDSSIGKMEDFYAGRDGYGSFEGFVPELAEYFDDAAKNIRRERKHYASLFPEVVSAKVRKNYSSDTLAVEFVFSLPMYAEFMDTGAYPYDEDGVVTVRPAIVPDDAGSIVVKIGKSDLEKGRLYGFTLPWKLFYSQKCYPMKGDYVFKFKY